MSHRKANFPRHAVSRCQGRAEPRTQPSLLCQGCALPYYRAVQCQYGISFRERAAIIVSPIHTGLSRQRARGWSPYTGKALRDTLTWLESQLGL